MRQLFKRQIRNRWFLAPLLLFCLILKSENIQASERRETEVRNAVETWVRHVTADSRSGASIAYMEPHRVAGETAAYIAHLAGGGYCLCGADDLVLPVYFYTPCGTYDPENPSNQYILWEIETRMKALRQGMRKGDADVIRNQSALDERASYWEALASGTVPLRQHTSETNLADPDSMSLDFACTWHQGSPYNDLCPELTPGADEHVIVGCTATSMTQIMYYWQWPPAGVGSASTEYEFKWRNGWDEAPLGVDPGIPAGWGGRLEWTATDGGRLRMNGYWDETVYEAAEDISDTTGYRDALNALWDNLTPGSTFCSADFGAATYDWSIMEDNHTDPPDAGDAEVAKLSYHGAVAIETVFGLHGSSGFLDHLLKADVEDALEDHFRYDTDATHGTRDIDTMTEEIQWLRPVQLRGTRPDTLGGGGHAWVVCGYNKGTDPARQFRMDLGWGGSCNGWYSCDNIPCAAFILDQHHITRIAPKDVVKFVDNTGSGDGSPSNPYGGIEEAVSEAPRGTTLIFKTGSVNTLSSSPCIINFACTLKGKDVVIRKQ